MPSLTTAKPFVTIDIDQPRRVRYTWKSAVRFEDAYHKSLPAAMGEGIGARLLTHLAWAGMLDFEPALSIREAENRMDKFVRNDGDVYKLAEELMKALAESGVLGKPNKEEKPEDVEGNEQTLVEAPAE